MTADGLTKPLLSPAFTVFRDSIGFGADVGRADMVQWYRLERGGPGL